MPVAKTDRAKTKPKFVARRARLVVSYKGDEFHGFALNPGVQTVASTLEGALAQIMQVPVKLTPAGRTDTGVHARGQVVSADLPRSHESRCARSAIEFDVRSVGGGTAGDLGGARL